MGKPDVFTWKFLPNEFRSMEELWHRVHHTLELLNFISIAFDHPIGVLVGFYKGRWYETVDLNIGPRPLAPHRDHVIDFVSMKAAALRRLIPGADEQEILMTTEKEDPEYRAHFGQKFKVDYHCMGGVGSQGVIITVSNYSPALDRLVALAGIYNFNVNPLRMNSVTISYSEKPKFFARYKSASHVYSHSVGGNDTLWFVERINIGSHTVYIRHIWIKPAPASFRYATVTQDEYGSSDSFIRFLSDRVPSNRAVGRDIGINDIQGVTTIQDNVTNIEGPVRWGIAARDFYHTFS